MAPTEAKQWILSSHPNGLPTYGKSDSNFTLQTKSLQSISDGQLSIQTLYLSNDPAQRGWISANIPESKLYVPPVKLNTPMHARGLAKVLESRAEGFKEGDVVQGNFGWVSNAVVEPKAAMARVVKEIPGMNITHYLGALGSTGLTAWYGLMDIAGCKEGDRVVVSGAAGAVGNLVVQLARIAGAKSVVGIAGSKEKCDWVKSSLGADECLNYKDSDFKDKLKAATKDGVDVFFDNVGGEILDEMLGHMSLHGRIACCGAITGYNDEDAVPFKNYFYVITMRLKLQGFIVIDALPRAQEIVGKLIGYIKEGKLKVGDESETVVDTKFEEVPGTWLKLFKGANQGKLITKLVD